jgi:ferredoxin
MAIKKIWVEDGCTVCHLCESTAPDIFETTDSTTIVKAGAEALFASQDAAIKDAASGCPVEIIKFEE